MDLTELSLEDLLELEVYRPTTVLGSHIHSRGEWMIMYHFMAMGMEGILDGTKSMSPQEVLNDFSVTPTRMVMTTHMTGVMYGLSDRITLMGLLPYKRISMDHRNRMGVEFDTRSEGIGDLIFGGIHRLYADEERSLHLRVSMGMPTGSIDRRDDTPMGPDQKLPYPMQLGSGTWDLLPGITYQEVTQDWLRGINLHAEIRTGVNDNDYRLGNRYDLTTWVTRTIRNEVGVTFRVEGQNRGNVHGADPELDPAMVPTADPSLQGGSRVDVFLGTSLFSPEGVLKNKGLEVEFGTPLYQSLNGPQLETDWLLRVNGTFTWGD
ncbi:MAG: transporter [Candidatus Eisenbacteria bacterium]